jgi:hypothetical protein
MWKFTPNHFAAARLYIRTQCKTLSVPPPWLHKATYFSNWYCVEIIASPVGLSADTSITLHRSVVSNMEHSLWFFQWSDHYVVSIKSPDTDTH